VVIVVDVLFLAGKTCGEPVVLMPCEAVFKWLSRLRPMLLP
jgi:hypothetical protein